MRCEKVGRRLVRGGETHVDAAKNRGLVQLNARRHANTIDARDGGGGR